MPDTPVPTVLVVEDDEPIRELIALYLRLEELTPVEAADGETALDLARARPFDLVILDLMLPKIDGMTLCRAIRRDSPNAATPLLMLTARSEEADKVGGLDVGADDYVTKPFNIRELMARVRALLRRGAARQLANANANAARQVLRLRNVEIDVPRRRVAVDGQVVELTFNEFELLKLLASQPGIVFSRQKLLKRIWSDETFVTVRSVDTLVKRLRRKIERDPSRPLLIVTLVGAGYKAADD